MEKKKRPLIFKKKSSIFIGPSLDYGASSLIKKRMSITVLDGNIGAGKSTAARKLKERFEDLKIYIEPSFENPFLEEYYENPQKICYDIENYLIDQRQKTYREALRLKGMGYNVVSDRSIFSSLQFLELNYKYEKNLSEILYKKLRSKIDEFVKNVEPPDLVIILDCKPKVCYKRIHERNEDNTILECENKISIEYLKNLDKCIWSWSQLMNERNVCVKVYDWNKFDEGHDYTEMLNK